MNPNGATLSDKQAARMAIFESQSAEAARGEIPFGYDDLEDWFETAVAEFRRVKLPIPERPGFMRTDAWTIERLMDLSDQLGRKLEADDVTPGLRRFATEWLRGLDTPIDFAFLAQLRFELEAKEIRQLSLGQAKGVLNSAIAGERRRPKAATKTEPVDLEAGIYFKDGVVYKVQVAVHGSGHPYAKRLVVAEVTATSPVFGTVSQGKDRGRFEYDKGAIRELRPEHRMTLEQAKEFGALYGVCCNCGATLTDETSIELGIGPICRTKFA